MIGLDLIAAIGGLIVPPVFDFIKKKFISTEAETPESTMSTLATTKPEALPGFVLGMVDLIKVKVSVFNKDVIGVPSQWVCDLRASIRPLATIIALGALIGDGFEFMKLAEGVRICFEVIASSWFGARLSMHK